MLKKFRLKNKLTQKKFADIIGIPRQTYQSYEYGTRHPSDEKLKKIEEAIRIINHSYIVNQKNKISVWQRVVFSLLIAFSLFIIFSICFFIK